MADPNSTSIKRLQMLIATKPDIAGAVRRPCTKQSRMVRGEGSSPLIIICSALSLHCGAAGKGNAYGYNGPAYQEGA
jgi:hypothetical protein